MMTFRIKNKIFAKLLCATLAMGAASSCNFLDVVPPESMEIDDTMKDKDRAEAFLYRCYEGIPSVYGQHLVRSFMSSADEFGLPDAWGVQSQQYAWGTINPGKVDFSVWENMYSSLGSVNNFLRLVDMYTPAHSTAEDIRRWKAECYFLLGFYHFFLLESYGPIPLVDHYYSSTTDKKDFPGRSHFDYCVTQICEWLDYAAANGLPDVINDSQELGRATTVAAKALKARVLLYAASPLWNGEAPESIRQWRNTNYETPGYGTELVSGTYDRSKWERAREACIEAIALAEGLGNRALYTLEDGERKRESENVSLPDIPGASFEVRQYASMMQYLSATTETDGNRETIFGVVLPTSDSWTSYFLDWENTCLPQSIIKVNGAMQGGRSGISPYLYTAEHFYTVNGKLPKNDSDYYKESEWFQSAGQSRPEIIKLNDLREPRFYAWISFDGAEYGSKLSGGSRLIVNMRDHNKQGYNPSKDNDLNITGYLCRKFVSPNVTKNSASGSTNTKNTPHPVIRLAELYLDLAECYAALGDNANAITNLNVIRERAGVPALTASDVNADMTMMDWVRNERFIELWGEGHRYFDLRRWCIAPQYLKAGAREGLNYRVVDPTFEELNQRVTLTNQPFVWYDRMYFIPVASSEVDSNPQLVQAPGY